MKIFANKMLTDEETKEAVDAISDMVIKFLKKLTETSRVDEETAMANVHYCEKVLTKAFNKLVKIGLSKDQALCILETATDVVESNI